MKRLIQLSLLGCLLLAPFSAQAYTVTKTVNYVPSKASLTTVGYTVESGAGVVLSARTTTGVVSLGGGSFAASVTPPDNNSDIILWDSGEAAPSYASDTLNPPPGVAPVTLASGQTVATVTNPVVASSVTGSVGSVTGSVGSVTGGVTLATSQNFNNASTAIPGYWASTTAPGYYVAPANPATVAVNNFPATVALSAGDETKLGNLDAAVSSRQPSGPVALQGGQTVVASSVTAPVTVTGKPAVTLAATDISGTPSVNAAQWGGAAVGGMPNSGPVVASNVPVDYQQRGVAVTLPATVPSGYGAGAAPADYLTAAEQASLAKLDATVSSRLAASAYTAPTLPPTVPQIAAGLLVNPAQPIATNASGYVTTSNPATAGSSVTEATIWAYGNRTLTAQADTPGTATLLARPAPANPTDYARNNAPPSWYAPVTLPGDFLSSTEQSQLSGLVTSQSAQTASLTTANAGIASALTALGGLTARTDPATALSALQSAIAALQAAATAIKAKTDALAIGAGGTVTTSNPANVVHVGP